MAATQIIGILNLTPDSFSDGGRYPTPQAAIHAAREMHAAGAAIIDIGAESTRPGAAPVHPDEELARLRPVVAPLAQAGLTLSIDTRHAATMQACLDAGATIINDVSALTHDPAAAPLIARRNCRVILMHMRGTPATMASHASYHDLIPELRAELRARRHAAEQAGIAGARILLDPGLGFAKTTAHTLEILRRLPELADLGPLVVGASRKRFIGELSAGAPAHARLGGSIAAALIAAQAGAAFVRVHDVPETIQALRLLAAISQQAPP